MRSISRFRSQRVRTIGRLVSAFVLVVLVAVVTDQRWSPVVALIGCGAIFLIVYRTIKALDA